MELIKKQTPEVSSGPTYSVTIPKILFYLGIIAMIFSACLELVFLLTYSPIHEDGSTTIGHLIFTACCFLCGMIICICSRTWRLSFNGSDLTVRRYFGTKRSTKISYLDPVHLSPKGLKLSIGGSRFCFVDPSCDNYSTFLQTLVEYGKLDNNEYIKYREEIAEEEKTMRELLEEDEE